MYELNIAFEMVKSDVQQYCEESSQFSFWQICLIKLIYKSRSLECPCILRRKIGIAMTTSSETLFFIFFYFLIYIN